MRTVKVTVTKEHLARARQIERYRSANRCSWCVVAQAMHDAKIFGARCGANGRFDTGDEMMTYPLPRIAQELIELFDLKAVGIDHDDRLAARLPLTFEVEVPGE